MNTTLWLHQLWAATCAVAVAALVLLWLPTWLRRRFGAGAAYALWWLLPAALVVCVVPAPTGASHLAGAAAIAKLRLDGVPDLATGAGAPLTGGDGASAAWLLCAWGVGAIAMAIWLCLRQRRYARTLGRLRHVHADLWRADSVPGLPALVGVVRPKIVLPVDFETRYADDEQQLMLAHERTHRRRGDHFANFGVAAMSCLFWFNPLMHLAAIRFRRDQELACDAAVLARHPGARRTYGDAMLKTLLAGQEAPLGCHWSVVHPLKERLMQLTMPGPSARLRRIGMAGVALVVSTGAFAFWSGRPSTPSDADAREGARLEIVVSRDGKRLASGQLWVPYGREAMFEVGEDIRVAGTVERPRSGTDASMFRSRYLYRHHGRWLVDAEPAFVAHIDHTPSSEGTFDNNVHVELMPRRAMRPAGANERTSLSMPVTESANR